MKFTVKEPASLLEFLLKATGTASKTKIRNLLQHGSVAVDGTVQKRATTALAAGQTVEIERKETIQAKKVSAHRPDAPFPVLYEDEYLIALEKPAGLLSIGTESEKTKTFYKAVSQYVKDASGDREKIFIVHRLDREVSGVMLFAKEEDVKHDLQENWSHTEKLYLALVEGHPAQESGTVRNWLKENSAMQVFVATERTPGAQLAVSHYRVLKTYASKSLLEVRIETGRKHQIRIHMAELKCPIVGDKKYGAIGNPIRRLGLHAFSLSFTHPVTGERIHLEAPVPAAFTRMDKMDK
jgi:23S rRNA pseudouridine1911/1915/1917 synthase